MLAQALGFQAEDLHSKPHSLWELYAVYGELRTVGDLRPP